MSCTIWKSVLVYWLRVYDAALDKPYLGQNCGIFLFDFLIGEACEMMDRSTCNLLQFDVIIYLKRERMVEG